MLLRTDLNSDSRVNVNTVQGDLGVSAPYQGYCSYIYDHGSQLLKGAVGILGLTTLGGLVYWGRSWFGGKSTDTEKDSVQVLDDNGKRSIQNFPDHSTSGSADMEKILRTEQHQISVDVTPKPMAQSSNNIFSTDDLVYQSKDVDFAPNQRKLLSTAEPTSDIYLPSVALSGITNGWGVKLTGEAANDWSGYSVSAAGDINGDGIDDLVIGAYEASPSGLSEAGISYVVFGKNITWNSTIALSSLNGLNGFKLTGETAYDRSGYSVSGAGDINGDGIDDLVIGANYASPSGLSGAGISYVVFGKNTTWSSTIALSSLNGLNGFKLTGEAANDWSGRSVSGAGDINGDGIDDLVIGANYASPSGLSGAGISYVVFGKNTTWSSTIALSSLNGLNGFKLTGEAAGDLSGRPVSAAGDINGDGIDDLVIGAFSASPSGLSYAGASYAVFGKNTTWSSTIALSSLNGLNGFKLTGEAANDWSGHSVSAAGDINGDGIDDLVIGADNASPSGLSYAGASYVVFGKNATWSSTIALSSLNGLNGFKLTGEAAGAMSGISVSAAGDINGDGIDDLIIGACGAPPSGPSYAGASYVVFGKNTIWNSTIALSSLNGLNGFKLTGEAAGDFSGRSVSSAGDINGDGIDDLVIGAYEASPSGLGGAGISYVVFEDRITLINNTLSTYQGRTINITDSMLGVTSTLNMQRPITFTISNIQYCSFYLSGLVTTTFTNQQIAAGLVQFADIDIHSVPSYQVSVNDGLVATVPVSADIQFISKPFLVNNHLIINQGQNLTLSNTILSAGVIGSNLNTLLFTMSAVQHGYFVLLPNIGTAITSFTQAAIANNTIVFIDDNTQVAPSYNISVSDGVTTVGPYSAIVTFDAYPVLANNQVSINQGQTLTISNVMLRATSVNTVPPTLTFAVSNVQHGHFAFSTSPTITITLFTQTQIDAGSVVFVHDNGQVAPSYQIAVGDGVLTTSPVSGSITFDAYPVLANNQVSINQGQTLTISNAMLMATSVNTVPPTLTFTVSNMQHGHFAFSISPTITITSFTQTQIDAGSVVFVHDNGQVAPSYLVAVGDGVFTTLPTNGTVIFDAYPVLVNNQISVYQGQTLTISNAMLRATSVNTIPPTLTFTVSNVQYGHFAYSSSSTVAIDSFTQADINVGNICFIQDGSENAPSYSITVSDGVMATQPVQAKINFFISGMESNNTIRNSIIGASVSGAFGLGVWVFKKYVDSKTSNEFGGADLQNRICFAIISRMKVSGCFGYMSNDTIHEFRSSITTIIKALEDLGANVDISKMRLGEVQKFVDDIARTTQKILIPKRNCGSKSVRFFKNYFVAEITPTEIEANAITIARLVASELNVDNANYDEHNQMPKNNNKASSIEMDSVPVEVKADSKSDNEIKRLREEMEKMRMDMQRLMCSGKQDESHTKSEIKIDAKHADGENSTADRLPPPPPPRLSVAPPPPPPRPSRSSAITGVLSTGVMAATSTSSSNSSSSSFWSSSPSTQSSSASSISSAPVMIDPVLSPTAVA